MQLLRIYDQTGYKMDDLLKMSVSEYNSILFAVVGINEQKTKDIKEQNAGIKAQT